MVENNNLVTIHKRNLPQNPSNLSKFVERKTTFTINLRSLAVEPTPRHEVSDLNLEK